MVKVNTVSDNSMSPYFQRDPLEFRSIGDVVAQVMAQESSPVQLAVKRSGAALTLYNCDGTIAPDASAGDKFTSELPVGATKRHEWKDEAFAVYPEAGATLSLKEFIDSVFGDDTVPDHSTLVIDQTRAYCYVMLNLDFDADMGANSDEVVTFLSEASQTWE